MQTTQKQSKTYAYKSKQLKKSYGVLADTVVASGVQETEVQEKVNSKLPVMIGQHVSVVINPLKSGGAEKTECLGTALFSRAVSYREYSIK